MAEQESTVSASIKAAGCAQWQAFMDAAAGAHLNPDTIAQLGRGAALLLRVAKASTSPDACAAARWLSDMVYTSALAVASLEDVQ